VNVAQARDALSTGVVHAGARCGGAL